MNPFGALQEVLPYVIIFSVGTKIECGNRAAVGTVDYSQLIFFRIPEVIREGMPHEVLGRWIVD